MREKIVGVIGGMGPEATVDFLKRLIAATPARDDGDHIRVLVDNNPKIPSRIAALIEGTGEDPAPVLCDMARGLEKQGADFLVVPCNTAHFYLPAIAESVKIPVLDMVGLSISALATASHRGIGMLASPAVRVVGLYETRLRENGMAPLFPDVGNEAKLLDVIRAVKAGNTGDGEKKVYAQIAGSLAGVDALLIACTELSVLGAPEGISQPYIDALDVLVAATIAAARG
jgi:aspartate racemase